MTYNDGHALGQRHAADDAAHGRRAIDYLANLPVLSDTARGYLDGARDILEPIIEHCDCCGAS